jgi:hypothetical protein
MTPKDRMHESGVRRQEFARLQEVGVKVQPHGGFVIVAR